MFIWILGWISLAAAVLIAAVVTAQNVRGSRGPAERRFVLWSCTGMWAASLTVLAAAVVLDGTWRYAIVLAWIIAAVPLVYRAAMRRQLIREAEELKRTTRTTGDN